MAVVKFPVAGLLFDRVALAGQVDLREDGSQVDDARHPRQRDRDDLPRTHDLAQPGLYDWTAADRRAAPAHGDVAKPSRQCSRAIDLLRQVRIPEPERRLGSVPA